MSTPRILFAMARADFLERIRRYSFLATLGLALFLGYSIASGQLVLVVGQNYRGVINSAWVGGLMAAMVNFFLGLFGFYLIKGSINRDYETGLGQIIATTPLKRPLYTLGKWLSNFAVLGMMVVILMAVAVVMQLLYREDPIINWWALLAPFLLLVLPFMAFIAALAVLFETIAWLRGGFGNVIYFFLFIMVIVMLSLPSLLGKSPVSDLIGVGILSNSMGQAARAAYPAYDGSFNMTWVVPQFQTFRWDGVAWTSELVLSRLILVFLPIGIAVLAAIFFDRFNPAHLLRIKRTKSELGSVTVSSGIETNSTTTIHLTPLANAQMRFLFGALFPAELKLFLKGQRWWWYAAAAGLVIAQLFAPLPIITTLLVVAWVWPILLLSQLGCRENRHDMRQIVFSTPHPLMSQLPAMWFSSFVGIALLGSGALVRFIIAGEFLGIIGWLTGALFIPTLALALGVWTGSNKAFEVLYVLWMYMILQKVSPFDFIGMTAASPWYVYILLALFLAGLAVLGRHVQLKGR